MVAVNEGALFYGVTVEVAEQMNRGLLLALHNHLAHVIYFLMLPGSTVSPPAIQVRASNIRTVVSVNHSIGIKHGNHLEDEGLA